MALIDETIKIALEELQNKEISLLDMDKKIQEIFKTKDSALKKVKDWVINTTNGPTITYNIKVKGQYIIYITFKILNGKNDKLLSDMAIKITEIIRV